MVTFIAHTATLQNFKHYNALVPVEELINTGNVFIGNTRRERRRYAWFAIHSQTWCILLHQTFSLNCKRVAFPNKKSRLRKNFGWFYVYTNEEIHNYKFFNKGRPLVSLIVRSTNQTTKQTDWLGSHTLGTFS